jgi:predicted nucleotidyltransferase
LAASEFLKSALARRRQISLGGQQVAVLALEDLMLMKMIAGRLQDLADLEKIERNKTQLPIDWSYIKQWRTSLGLEKR